MIGNQKMKGANIYLLYAIDVTFEVGNGQQQMHVSQFVQTREKNVSVA